MNFILYIIFLSRRNADNGLPWIKPVQKFYYSHDHRFAPKSEMDAKKKTLG